MNRLRIVASATVAALCALGAEAAVARPAPLTQIAVPAQRSDQSSTKVVRLRAPAYVPVKIPTYIPYGYVPAWATGFNQFGLLPGAFGLSGVGASGLGFGAFGSPGLMYGACQSPYPRTLGDLGSAGAGTGFAPVTFSSAPAFDYVPSATSPLAPSSYCQPPMLEPANLDLGD